jgi:thiol:disulfide interchange protein DsbA
MSAAAWLAAAGTARSSEQWVEGKHYFKVDPPRPTDQPAGTVTVTEVFSYACPACNAFLPFMHGLQKRLPSHVVLDYVPASWLANEDWPVFQRAYVTAKSLGIAERTHDAMFEAIWGKNGELATFDAKTEQPKAKMPDIEDVARFYQRVAGVAAAQFVQAAASFAVEVAIKRSDEIIKAYRADRTPTLVVNGKYRVDPTSADGNPEEMVALTLWLVEKERGQSRS